MLGPKGTRALAAYGGIGMEIVIAICLGLFGGRWLDRRYAGGGLFTVGGLLLGLVVAGRSLWRAAKQAEKDVS